MKESPETCQFLTKDSARKSMQDARSKKIPPCPVEMRDVIAGFEAGSYEMYQDMLLGHVTWEQRNKGTQYALILGDRKLFKEVTSDSTFYFCDGTFRITPRQARVLSIRGSQVPLIIISRRILLSNH